MKILKDSSGATAIEYGLIAALIATAVLAILGAINSPETAEDPVPTPSTEEYEAVYGDPS